MSRLKQPAPIVSKADVERIVRRDDSRDNFHKVISMLNDYGAEDRQREPDRVRLAVLKLANGNIEELKRFLGWAKCDYRDVLSPAEYPMASEIWFRMEKMIKEDIETIFQQDWEQYWNWIKKGLAQKTIEAVGYPAMDLGPAASSQRETVMEEKNGKCWPTN